MSTEVDNAFIKQYEDQVHLAYQRMGSKLRNFVRVSTKMPGQDITFPKIGKGAVQDKPRHGDVTPMNVGHTSVTVTLVDKYAPEYIDKFDAFKTNIDLQSAYAKSGAYALGRYTDEQIITAIETSTYTSSTSLSAITTLLLAQWKARLLERDVPDDGQIAAAVSPMVWAKMISLQEFSNSQWVGPESLPFKTRMEAKFWNGITWIQHTGLGGSSTARRLQMWHPNAIGHGIHSDVVTEVNYIPQKVSTLVNSMMSMGAVAIDQTGVEEWIINEGD